MSPVCAVPALAPALRSAAAATVAAAAVLAAAAGTASASGARAGSPPAPRSSVVQKYDCAAPQGHVTERVRVSGSAYLSSGSIVLSGVRLRFTNDFGTRLTVSDVRFRVPDPDRANAPYRPGSASVSKRPPGWRAGHTAVGVFELRSATLRLADGAVLPAPVLRASYRDAGPKGRLISWKPGRLTFREQAPRAGDVTCTPVAPVQAFASILT